MAVDVIFTIDPTQVTNTNNNGTYIEDGVDYTKIKDGAEISTRAFNKMTTSIPTPFARVFLYNGAFETLNAEEKVDENGFNPNKGKAYYGPWDPVGHKYLPTLYHYVVADALDMLEFLFEYGSDPNLVIEKWNVEDDLERLKSEEEIDPNRIEVTEAEKHNLLYGALKSATTDGVLGRTFYIFKWRYQREGKTFEQVIGGTSPMTLVYTAPNWRTMKPRQFFGGKGNELFIKELSSAVPPVPLIQRSKAFRTYMYGLLDNHGIKNPFFEYISTTRENYERPNSAMTLPVPKKEFDENPSYSDIRDKGGNRLMVSNIPFKNHNKSALDPECPYVIIPTVEKIQDEYNSNGVEFSIEENLPLALSVDGIMDHEDPHYWYEAKLGNHNETLQKPSAVPYYERSLPNVPGEVKYPNLRAEDLFEDKIVKVGFRLNRNKFITGANGHCQFLLPIKATFFKFFRAEDLKNMFTLEVRNDGSVKATLKIPVGKAVDAKVKEELKALEESGKPIDETTKQKLKRDVYGYVKFEKVYSNIAQIGQKEIIMKDRFNLALFPFYRLEGEKGADAKYNTYEVMLAHDGTADLKFYNDDINDYNSHELGLRKRTAVKVESVNVRTNDPTPNTGIVTTYYHLGESSKGENTADGTFQVIEARFDDGYKGLIVPDWSTAQTSLGIKEYIFCVDFGTANTHVSYAEFKGGIVDNSTLHDLEYSVEEQVVTLNESGSLGTFNKFDIYCQREFVPQVVVKGGDVEFPIRTLIFEKDGTAQLSNLFGDMNIAFKLREDQPISNGRLKSNIKWGTDLLSQNRIKAFFTELMWIIKNKVVSMGGKMTFKFIFTFPQSMRTNQQTLFAREWANARDYVRAGDPKVNNWSVNTVSTSGRRLIPYEGTAPWYRSLKEHGPNEKFMNIDIGGGTFDVIAVLPNVQNMQSAKIVPGKSLSAQFAASVLWGHGERILGERTNGFLEYYLRSPQGQTYAENNKGFNVYQQTADSPADVIAYLFKHKDSRFSESIQAHPKLRSLVVLHFASIVYYVGRALMLDEIDCPGCMRFTGMGSMYIDLITESHTELTDLVRAILRYASNNTIDIPDNFTVEYDVHKYHPKKITAEGGVTMWNTTLTGAATPIVDPMELMVYGFEDDEDDLEMLKEDAMGGKKDAVAKRMEHFFGLFKDPEVIQILNTIGISDLSHLNYQNVKGELSNSFDLLLMNYNANANPQVDSKEAIFFWPLKDGIHKLALIYGKTDAPQ